MVEYLDGMYRQGDVLLRRIDKIPEGVTKKDNTVAYGEATNHSHVMVGAAEVFIAENETQYVDVRDSDTFIVHTKDGAHASKLSNADHKEILIPPGQYEVVQQREYDYTEHISRKVLD